MALPGVDFPGLGCGLAIVRDGKILLCRRLKAPEARHWSIVGGKVDQMERAQDAARREAQEESGLSIHSIRFLCISEQLIEAERQHWVSLIYVTEDFSGEPRLTEPDKLSDIRWFDLTALPQPLSRFAADAIRALA
ncbi:NUDIX domain-containing protein [Sinorhizobium medicae]|uniref:NUDIX hydrolase n=3 Tax=Sinorhizobium medicae TaxID=110321 RepID=A6U9J4_SINMW|nr:NUDIX domain-containing protein [Sinorhizobium medicae]ABR60324.1 NUDIX hydrolase [Sinorhizobium medicae WSM419]MBO1962490.1 NUDIX domain-containing protein [Sinorhizobium medicae]MDX0407639.1 NUDIX domain-containing protein [Sinorhizobium medicae]MDX0414426.1 NUDIX domain-containing protein [Sinorhizobium medicae]MDX0419569.1 NUDIX domain-containing protein [Sinorhizobium medicae]